ncbi:MAG TPA: M48 family metallopeptidase [Syntrophales bacterium]|nr:M48 family metallopeptidase [Syntrophales bacterium]
MRYIPWRRMALYISIIALAGCASQTASQTKVITPDWQNPIHRKVGEQFVPLLVSAGRSPANCQVFFIESTKINAMSLGGCKFGFTMGLVNTGDERLIRGVAAHEIGHEVLGHADKRKTAIAAEQLTRTALSFIPGLGGLIASNAVAVTGMLALPAYSRSQETDADSKAVEILSKAGDPDPAGTMAYSFRFLLKSSGATGGGLLDSHPNTRERLEAMLKLGSTQTNQIPSQTVSPVKTPAAPAQKTP